MRNLTGSLANYNWSSFSDVDLHIIVDFSQIDENYELVKGFFDNARREDTGLGDFLQNEGIMNVFVTGLAQDYCVKFTALDAVSLGFKTYLITDATKAVNVNSADGEMALEELKKAGVILIDSKTILD